MNEMVGYSRESDTEQLLGLASDVNAIIEFEIDRGNDTQIRYQARK